MKMQPPYCSTIIPDFSKLGIPFIYNSTTIGLDVSYQII